MRLRLTYRLAYVRNGLLLAKLKFLKLYKRFGDGTFASFCREQLNITRWQVNDNIKAARVCMELIYAGFEILPTNISQAMALASLMGDELVHAWRSVTESIDPDCITHKSIRSLLFPPNALDLPSATIRVTPTLHETIHREAADLGLSIPEFIWTILRFFASGGEIEPDAESVGHEQESDTTPNLQGDAGSARKPAELVSAKATHAGQPRRADRALCATGKLCFRPFVASPNLGVNSHLFEPENKLVTFAEKERIWRDDLANLVAEGESKRSPRQYKSEKIQLD